MQRPGFHVALIGIIGTLLSVGVGRSRLAHADVTLPAIIGDHMVLQEGRALPVWGHADPGESVTVAVLDQTKTVTADKDGNWRVTLEPIKHREPFQLQIKGGEGRNVVKIVDVVTGEVWLASGQSNMEFAVARARDAETELLRAGLPRLRLFQVIHGARLPETATDVNGRWVVSSPVTAAQFSAVAFFFGRDLLQHLDRPVGLIASSWGGTPAEAWTSRAALAANPLLRGLLGPQPNPLTDAKANAAYVTALAGWDKENIHVDAGNRGEGEGWARAGIPEAGWKKMMLPGLWEDRGLNIDGAVWFRKEVDVPPDWVGKPIVLHLGALNDCDTVYVNGHPVGATCHETPISSESSRVYDVPAELVRAGRLLVAVRIFDERGKGGFAGVPESLRLALSHAPDAPTISLAGRWNYRVERELPQLDPHWEQRPEPPASFPDAYRATHLYNQMIAPLIPFALRGVIWYQGEANVSRARQYRVLFPALIQSWRQAWGQGDFPFLFVQLANFSPGWPEPGHRNDEEWPALREAQTLALNVPNTAMAVAIDVGNRDDIHPTDKQTVAARLSLCARAKAYGESNEYSGPIFKGFRIEKDRVRITFTHGAGLVARPYAHGGGHLIGFELAGRDRRFVAAAATIDGESVVLSAPGLKAPVAARYEWADSPLGNLGNGQGLPASPFRTDAW